MAPPCHTPLEGPLRLGTEALTEALKANELTTSCVASISNTSGRWKKTWMKCKPHKSKPTNNPMGWTMGWSISRMLHGAANRTCEFRRKCITFKNNGSRVIWTIWWISRTTSTLMNMQAFNNWTDNGSVGWPIWGTILNKRPRGLALKHQELAPLSHSKRVNNKKNQAMQVLCCTCNMWLRLSLSCIFSLSITVRTRNGEQAPGANNDSKCAELSGNRMRQSTYPSTWWETWSHKGDRMEHQSSRCGKPIRNFWLEDMKQTRGYWAAGRVHSI